MKIKSFKIFNESVINEGRDAICGTCGEHGYDEDLDRACSNCGDDNWTQDFEGADDDDEDQYESENVDVNENQIEMGRLTALTKNPSITVLGGDKHEQMFRDAFKDSIVIPVHPDTGEVTYDGNKIGFVDNFSGLVFTDVKWIATHLDKINDIVKETGFWYG